VRSWSQDLLGNAIRAADIPEPRSEFLAAPRHSRSTVLVGELHERLDRRLDGVKIDDPNLRERASGTCEPPSRAISKSERAARRLGANLALSPPPSRYPHVDRLTPASGLAV
jgi:hypothetical protein